MILAGDIGGTKTLLAAFDGPNLVHRRRYGSRDFASFAELLAHFIADAAAALGNSARFRLASDCYGALAGDHALAVLARGGVFIAGGIAPKLLPRLRAGGFLAAFNDKGAFAAAVRACPVHVVVNPDLPLLGAARHAEQLLTTV
jgi:glucokinase